MNISELQNPIESDIEQIASLLGELRAKAVPVESVRQDIIDLANSEQGVLLVARNEDGVIVGSVIVNIVNKLGKQEARVDEVIVSESARGHNLGTRLMEASIEWSWDHGVDQIELTSRPSREAAIHIYEKLGFKKRETNVYTLKQ